MNSPINATLLTHTKAGELVQPLPHGWLQCLACGHRCKIPPGRDGICRVRINQDGVLLVPHGYAAGVAVDPIEKKPFFHAYPGSGALSFGMLGCDYHCPFCQNWHSSQILRDPLAFSEFVSVTAGELVKLALDSKARMITSTYNEPLITAEWALEIFKLAKQAGLVTSFVSNGNATPEVLEYLAPWLDLYKVDLKGFTQSEYAKLGGVLQNVLDTIRSLYQRGIWLEVVTLLVPGMNTNEEELRDIASFIVSVSPDIPWHVTAFHQDYKMLDTPTTSAESLIRAAEIGYTAGLRYVYTGNRPGQTRNYENTYCHSCHSLLIERKGFRVTQNYIGDGICPSCKTSIPGRWK
jgi:pyruvate formate lyase activating enzyme